MHKKLFWLQIISLCKFKTKGIDLTVLVIGNVYLDLEMVSTVSTFLFSLLTIFVVDLVIYNDIIMVHVYSANDIHSLSIHLDISTFNASPFFLVLFTPIQSIPAVLFVLDNLIYVKVRNLRKGEHYHNGFWISFIVWVITFDENLLRMLNNHYAHVNAVDITNR